MPEQAVRDGNPHGFFWFKVISKLFYVDIGYVLVFS